MVKEINNKPTEGGQVEDYYYDTAKGEVAEILAARFADFVEIVSNPLMAGQRWSAAERRGLTRHLDAKYSDPDVVAKYSDSDGNLRMTETKGSVGWLVQRPYGL